MDEEYRTFKRYLKSLNRDSFTRLCEVSMLTEEEVRLVSMYYCERKTESYIADSLGMSISTYHNARMDAISKIRNWIHLHLYRPEMTSFKDRIRILNDFLYKNNGNSR